MSKISLSSNILGTGTLTIASPNTDSDRTLTLPDNTGTVITTASTFAGTGPAFSVYCSTAQVISNATATKIALNTEIFDTNNNFDSTTNYRFTPTVAGYYQFCGGVYISVGAGGVVSAGINKNGAQVFASYVPTSSNGVLTPMSGLVYMNGTTDYVEFFVFQNSGGSATLIASRPDINYFFGAMVRAA